MVALNREQTALYAAHEHIVDETVRYLRRKYPALDVIDPESVGRMALYEASARSQRVRVSFSGFARMHIRCRLLMEFRKHRRREHLCARRDVPMQLLESKLPIEHSALYDAIDKLPPELRSVVAFQFGLVGRVRQQPRELVTAALEKLKELLG